MQEPQTTQEIAADLYNQLINLPFEERERIGKVEWNLRGLRKKDPGDIPTAVAYLQAAIMSGKPDVAHEVANDVWPRRLAAESAVAWTFVTQLVELGRFAPAAELMDSLRKNGRLDGAPNLAATAMHIAVGLGDAQRLRVIAQSVDGTSTSRNILGFIERLERTAVAAHFRKHQEIVRSIVADAQCTYEASFWPDDDGVELSVFIYVNLPKVERRALEAAIDARLSEYYVGQGMDPGCYVPWFTTSVLDISACPAPVRTRH